MGHSQREPVTLLKTKLHKPYSGSGDLLPRPELLQRLNLSPDSKLILVCAPAGFGKTTLLCQWLEQTQFPSAWLSLDSNDNDQVIFLSYFIAAIQTIFPEACQNTQNLLNADLFPPLEHIVTSLVNEIAELPGKIILVLDDYHTIEDETVHKLLGSLIKNLPSQAQLAIASRSEPPLTLVGLRARRQMLEIRANDLRLNIDETQTYLEKTSGVKLTREEALIMEERTEGWIVGLRLAALSMRGLSDVVGFVSSFRGSHRDLIDYMLVEVLSLQPPEVQNFLIHTSILDRFCAPLCDRLFDYGQKTREELKAEIRGFAFSSIIDQPLSSQTIIDYLERNNLFMVSLDYERRWFRYHHLFQELLRHQLGRVLTKGEQNVLHSNAAGWLAEHGFIDEALKHWLSAGDLICAASLVEANRIELLNRQNRRRLEYWLGLFPEQVVQERPALLITRAWSMQFRSKFNSMDRILKLVERQLDNDRNSFSEAGQLTLHGEVDTMRSMYWLILRNNPQRSFECAQRALENVSKEFAEARGLALAMLCLSHTLMGQTEIAINKLEEAIEPAGLYAPSKFQALISLSYIYLLSGDLEKVLNTARYLLQLGHESNQIQSIAWGHYFIGLVHYEWNDLETALEHFIWVSEQRYNVAFMTYHNAIIGLGMVYMALNRHSDAIEALESLLAYSIQSNISTYMADIDSSQARLSLNQGDLASASRWAKSTDWSELIEPLTSLEMPSLSLAWVLICKASPAGLAEAQQLLIGRLKDAQGTHNTNRSIKILALQALVYESQGLTDEALESLESALKLAQYGVYVRTFVDLGAEIAGLLRQLSIQSDDSDYINSILVAFPQGDIPDSINMDETAQRIWLSSKQILTEPLTRRESEILLQLAYRRTNQQIAELLFISPLTVKKHTINIYQKLGVNSREAAVVEFQRLGGITLDRNPFGSQATS